MEFQELNTKRLNLVQIGKEHAESFFDIMSKDEVTKYYGMSSLTKIEDAEKIVESFQKTLESKRGIRWGLVEKESKNFIGTVGLNNLNPGNKRAEVGFELHPSYWNKGYTSEAVKEVLSYCFRELKLFRIGAVTFPQNNASITLLENIGFEKEGVLRGYLFQDNQSHDAFVFSLLEGDWTQSLTKG